MKLTEFVKYCEIGLKLPKGIDSEVLENWQMNRLTFKLAIVLLSVWLGSCKMYKQDILFRLDENFTAADLSQRLFVMEQNYTIQPNDILEIRVTTNKGEILIDPNFELMNGQGAMGMQQGGVGQNLALRTYTVQSDGKVKFPVVDIVEIAGLTLLQAESKLQQLYNEYYKDSFVRLVYNNKRVFVLGANGGAVVPLKNENTSLMEVLATYGGINMGAKANNIKVIRGDLTNPQVFMVDLTTVAGMKASMVTIMPGDIIYIEPWRRVLYEGLRDISPILSLVSSVIALVFVFSSL